MKRYIRSSFNSSISVETLIQKIQDIYHTKFPGSRCFARLHYINDMAITIRPLLCDEISDVNYGYFGDVSDPFDIELDVEFPNTSRGEVTLDTEIDSQYIFEVNIRIFHMETGRLFVDQKIPFPDATSCGMEEKYNRYYGNYASVLKLWGQYVGNIYETLLQLKEENNLSRTILETPTLRAKVNNL